MYSDYLEVDLDKPSSKDCYLFNDQSPIYEPTYTMAEMNEIGTQSNFDYVLNSYYVPVNQYNTGFSLLDDYKNMSFSELFDQELFSSHENKDCQITIKIEEEEPLDPCFSADESQDITDSHILVKPKESFPSPTRNYSLKRGINRTFIKPTENCDVTHLLNSPFCDTDDFSIDQISVKKAIENCEPDINNTIKQNIGPIVNPKYCPVHDSQKAVVNLNFEKTEDSILFSSKSSTSNIKINKIVKKKSENNGVKHLVPNVLCKTVNCGNNIVSCAPDNINRFIEQNIVPLKIQSNYLQGDSKIEVDSHNIIKVKENESSLLSLKILPKKVKINGTSINSTENDVKQPVYNSFGEPENIDSNQKSTKVRGHTVKRKPKDVINTLQQKNIKPGIKSSYSDHNLQNTTDNQNLVKIEDVLKNSTSIRQGNKGIFTNAIEKSDVKHPLGEQKILGNDQMSGNMKPYVFKRKLMYTNNIAQNIFETKVKPWSSDNSQNTTNYQNKVKTEETLKTSTPKRRSYNKTSKKITEKNDVKHFPCNPFSESKVHANDQISVKTEPYIKEEPMFINYNIEQNIHEVEVEFTNDLQNITNYQNKVKTEETLKTSTPKCRSYNKTSKKITENNDVKHLSCNNFNESIVHGNDLIPVKIEPYIKEEPIYINYDIEQNIEEIEIESTDDLQNITNYQNKVKTEETLKTSTTKRRSYNKTSTKITEKNDVKHFPPCNPFGESKVHANDQISVKTEPYIEEEHMYINYNINEIEVESTDDLHNTANCQNSVKTEEILKTSTPKHQNYIRYSEKPTEKMDVKYLSCKLFSESKVHYNDLLSVKIEPYIKKEPTYINYNIEQNIDEIEVMSSIDDLQNTTNYQTSVKIEQNFPKHQDNNNMVTKLTEKKDVKQILYNFSGEPNDIGNHQLSVKIEPCIKKEPMCIDDSLEQNCGDMIEEYNHINVKETNHVSSNEFCCTNSNNKTIKSHEITVIKQENIVPDLTFLKNDEVESQTFTIKNEVNLETEKKKISWEEFRAKRGKIDLTNISEKDEKISKTCEGKVEAIIKEFDRNTAEYFNGQKRKLKNKEEKNTISAKDSSEMDEELQKKRMKIEYIKKLLPSSFASEIAKTSSLMKGSSQENIDDESTLTNTNMSKIKNQDKYTHEENIKKDDKFKKKGYQARVYSSHRISSRADYCNKSNRSSNSDDYYNRNRIVNPHQGGPYGHNIRNNGPRSKDQKRVVYVGQIPIKYGKRYLYNRFKEFGIIQALTLHKKPDFRVYYAFVTYTERSEAERAINHGNDDVTHVQLDIRFGERKQTQTPYYDLDDEWLTDWYTYASKLEVVRPPLIPENSGHSFEEELKEFYNLAQMKKLNEIKSSSQVS